MGPKVRAACEFVEQTGGMRRDRLDRSTRRGCLRGDAGTTVTLEVAGLELAPAG